MIHLQDIDAKEKGVPVVNVSSNAESSEDGVVVANISSNAASGEDLTSVPEGVSVQAPLDSSSQLLGVPKPSSSGLEICSTLQFSLQDLKKRRQRRLSLWHSSNDNQRAMKKRCILIFTLEILRVLDPALF